MPEQLLERRERSTVDLMQRFDTGAKVDAVFKFTRSFGGGGIQTVMEIRLTSGKVVGIEPWSRNGADGSDEFERVMLDYGTVQVTYNEYDETGSLQGTESYTLSKP